jgi:UDP-N-acetylglucosamine--N-acetylmuramyl-(pentapeptide) pyrophosphoryl-undecaprenol N-acetylglucosamine transferase
VYPSLSVAGALQELVAAQAAKAEDDAPAPDLELLYIGVKGRVDERIVPRTGIPFRTISAGQLRVSNPITFAVNSAKLLIGTLQALSILRRAKPNAVFATGGYASVPVGIAARLLRRPLVVYLPDVTPGWAVRMLARLATRVATTSDRALEHLPRAKTHAVGYPVRPEFWALDRAEARTRLNLPADAKVVLITGASLGARKINEAVVSALPELLDRYHLLHLTGAADEGWVNSVRTRLPREQRERYLVRGFLDDMPAALIAADLVVSRAGASTLGELPAAGVPAILIPGEYEGWSQAPNAEYLATQGAAVILRNERLELLAPAIMEILDDAPRVQRMKDASRALARPGAARDLAQMLVEVGA